MRRVLCLHRLFGVCLYVFHKSLHTLHTLLRNHIKHDQNYLPVTMNSFVVNNAKNARAIASIEMAEIEKNNEICVEMNDIVFGRGNG